MYRRRIYVRGLRFWLFVRRVFVVSSLIIVKNFVVVWVRSFVMLCVVKMVMRILEISNVC